MGSDFAAGEERYRAGAYQEAAAIFERLDGVSPDHSGAVRMLGLCRLRLGQKEEAVALLERALALSPHDPFTSLHYGIGLHVAGRYEEAAALFRKCAPLLPSDPAPYLNLSSTLLVVGDTRGALDAARRARRRAPKLGQALYVLGMAYLACERLDDAMCASTEALRRDPRLADAWVNIGIIHYRRYNIEAAKTAMRRALAIAPYHAVAAANLAVFLRLTGQAQAAEQLLNDLLTRFPDLTEIRVNLAANWLSDGRHAEALALLDAKPIPNDRRLARHWQMQLTVALLELGRTAEAREAIDTIGEVPPELVPLMLWRRVLLAETEGDSAAARANAVQMEQALAKHAALSPEHRIMAHFDLGQFWAVHRDSERAIAQWTEGHRLLSQLQPFSRAEHRTFVDATMLQFDRTRLHEGPRAKNRDQTPVFVVGMPRSGTTLAEQIIASHPQAFGAGERTALHEMFSRFGDRAPQTVARIVALDQAQFDIMAESYLTELHSLAPDKDCVVDKMPGNFNYLGLAALILPGARIIHCVRDPRDIGFSIFTYRFYGYHPYAHDLGDLGWYIAEHDRIMGHWREVLPNPILTLALTDWIDDFDSTLRRVLDFIGLPYNPACARFYERETRVWTVSRSQVRQPINRRGLGRWRAYAQQLAPLIAALEKGGVTLND